MANEIRIQTIRVTHVNLSGAIFSMSSVNLDQITEAYSSGVLTVPNGGSIQLDLSSLGGGKYQAFFQNIHPDDSVNFGFNDGAFKKMGEIQAQGPAALTLDSAITYEFTNGGANDVDIEFLIFDA